MPPDSAAPGGIAADGTSKPLRAQHQNLGVGEDAALKVLRRYLATPTAEPGRVLEIARSLKVHGPVHAALDIMTKSWVHTGCQFWAPESLRPTRIGAGSISTPAASDRAHLTAAYCQSS